MTLVGWIAGSLFSVTSLCILPPWIHFKEDLFLLQHGSILKKIHFSYSGIEHGADKVHKGFPAIEGAEGCGADACVRGASWSSHLH